MLVMTDFYLSSREPHRRWHCQWRFWVHRPQGCQENRKALGAVGIVIKEAPDFRIIINRTLFVLPLMRTMRMRTRLVNNSH